MRNPAEILVLTLVGAGFTGFGALGLYWRFDDPTQNKKAVGVLMALVCLPAGLTFYGWARFGSPEAFWTFWFR